MKPGRTDPQGLLDAGQSEPRGDSSDKHKIVSPIDEGTVRRPNGTVVHLFRCADCGVRVTRSRDGRFAHFTNDGRKRGTYNVVKNSDLRWPYGQADDALVITVNDAIPRTLPEQIREEACQELALALLEGRASKGNIAEAATEATRRARSGYQFSARTELSMDIPAPGQTSDAPLRDLLASSSVVDVAAIATDPDDCGAEVSA